MAPATPPPALTHLTPSCLPRYAPGDGMSAPKPGGLWAAPSAGTTGGDPQAAPTPKGFPPDMKGSATSSWARPAAAATALAVVAIATGASPLVLLSGAVAITFVHMGASVSRDVCHGSTRELEQHLARCRRDGNGADLVLVRGRGAASAARTVRAADSLRIDGSGPVPELVVVADSARLDRQALETRLREHAGDGVQIAWATFPEDGYVLDDLVAVARERADATGRPLELPRLRRLSVPLSLEGVTRASSRAA